MIWKMYMYSKADLNKLIQNVNDYQVDNYNSIFSKLFNDKN